jgi:hypothetical protein
MPNSGKMTVTSGSTVQSITHNAEAKLEILRSFSFHDDAEVLTAEAGLDHQDCCLFRLEESKNTSPFGAGCCSPPAAASEDDADPEMTLHTSKSSGMGGQLRHDRRSGQILFSFPNLRCKDGGGRMRNFRREEEEDEEDLRGEGDEKDKAEEEVSMLLPLPPPIPLRCLNPSRAVDDVVVIVAAVAVVVVVAVLVDDGKKPVVANDVNNEEDTKASADGGMIVIVSSRVNKKDSKM